MKSANPRRAPKQPADLSRTASAAKRATTAPPVAAPSDFAQRNIAALQTLVGNRTTARMIGGQRGFATSGWPVISRPGIGIRRSLIQRHLPGVLAKLSEDLTKVRATMTGYDTADPTNGDLMAYVNKHVTDIAALPGMVTVVDSKDKLVVALAEDLVARAPTPTTLEAVMPNATDEVMNKGGGGFTAKDGTVWMLESTNDSSALYHELIHVLSGEGGVTQLSVTKTNLNEGFTNYFAEALATKYGKTIFPAYLVATAWVKKFVAKFGESVAYNLYFKNNEALLYSTLAKQLKTNLDADKVIVDANKALKSGEKPAPTKLKSTDISMFTAAGKIKDEAAIAAVVKKKITEAYFMDVGEASLVWMDRVIFS